jgi:hypothetical protein
LHTIGGDNPLSCTLTIDNSAIQWVSKIKYLGVFILSGKSFHTDSSKAKGKYFGCINSILSVMGKSRNEMVAVKLVTSHCLPTLTYDCEVWSVKAEDLHKMNVMWNNSFRRIFNCCWRESVCSLQYFCGTMSLSYIVDQRWLLFWLKISKSENILLRTLANFTKNEHLGISNKFNIANLHCSVTEIKQAIWKSFALKAVTE